jgi:hypothetical protein
VSIVSPSAEQEEADHTEYRKTTYDTAYYTTDGTAGDAFVVVRGSSGWYGGGGGR